MVTGQHLYVVKGICGVGTEQHVLCDLQDKDNVYNRNVKRIFKIHFRKCFVIPICGKI